MLALVTMVLVAALAEARVSHEQCGGIDIIDYGTIIYEINQPGLYYFHLPPKHTMKFVEPHMYKVTSTVKGDQRVGSSACQMETMRENGQTQLNYFLNPGTYYIKDFVSNNTFDYSLLEKKSAYQVFNVYVLNLTETSQENENEIAQSGEDQEQSNGQADLAKREQELTQRKAELKQKEEKVAQENEKYQMITKEREQQLAERSAQLETLRQANMKQIKLLEQELAEREAALKEREQQLAIAKAEYQRKQIQDEREKQRQEAEQRNEKSVGQTTRMRKRMGNE